jgi:hypothetical protein
VGPGACVDAVVKRKIPSFCRTTIVQQKSYKCKRSVFLPARPTRAVSGSPAGSHNGRKVVTNCDGRIRHSREGREI